jgi:hypothetical protein
MHKRSTFVFVCAAVALSFLASGCYPVTSVLSSPQTPQEVVTGFYQWYSEYAGNPLADGAYRSNDTLTPALIKRVDDIVVGFDRGGYDPFLCAQDVPGAFTVDEAEIVDQVATTTMHQTWNPDSDFETKTDVAVKLELVDGQWRLSEVTCGGTETGDLSPDATVQAFYDWYLAYIGNRADGKMRNPLADGAYRSSEFLAASLIARVDEAMSSLDKGGYDPFLCAQDIPESVTAEPATGSGEEARVDVRTSFEGHVFTVTLEHTEDGWLISDIACR